MIEGDERLQCIGVTSRRVWVQLAGRYDIPRKFARIYCTHKAYLRRDRVR